jgi:hypothetical protein
MVLLALITGAVCNVYAQEISERDIELALRSKTCPTALISLAHMCQETLRQCAAHVTWECDAAGDACLRHESDLNKKIVAYNAMYYACKRSLSDSDLLHGLKTARQKARNVDEVNTRERRTLELRYDVRHQKQVQEEQAAQQKVAEQQLQAEKEEQERLRVITEEKAARRSEEDRLRARLAEQGRRPPRQENDDGWTCRPDYDSCKAYCRDHDLDDGRTDYCGGICSENGTRNQPKPSKYGSQRCYHPR